MCRSITVLREGSSPAPREEVRAAALQFVRKISGFRDPSPRHIAAFQQAVDEIADSSQRLLSAIEAAWRN